ncbi:MAG: cation diffusion facilitator family transporter, partial [Deltaproteobacteria bacterium]
MVVTERIAWLSIMTNLLLVAIKAGLAFFSGSLAIKADAFHSLSDVASSVIILLGVKISERPAPGFPYGLYKVENLVALGSSLLILFAGYEICVEVFAGPGIPPTKIPWAIAGIGLTIFITWLFAGYEFKKGKETGSPSLVADARHIRSDMLSSLVILVSLLGVGTGLHLDRYAALIVVVFIGRAAGTIFLDSVRVLLDASLDDTSLNRILEIVLADPNVEKVNAIRARNAGRYKFVELDLALRVKELAKAHKVSKEISQRVKEAIPHVDRVVIHSQPPEQRQLTVAIPLAADQRSISEHFGEAPYFHLVTFRNHDGAIISEKRLPNPHQQEEKAKGIKVANWLLANGLDILLVHRLQSGKGPSLALENGGDAIQMTEATDVGSA